MRSTSVCAGQKLIKIIIPGFYRLGLIRASKCERKIKKIHIAELLPRKDIHAETAYFTHIYFPGAELPEVRSLRRELSRYR